MADNELVMMKCGHAANATTQWYKGKMYDPPQPVCVICNEMEQIATPNLEGRSSKCRECMSLNSIVPSSMKLPFFKFNGGKSYDTHYCGCNGWD